MKTSIKTKEKPNEKEKNRTKSDSKVTERLLDYLKTSGINRNSFYVQTGISNGYLDKANSIGSNMLEKIHYAFPDLNIGWLITGEEEMIEQKVGNDRIKSLPVFDVYGHAGKTTLVNTMEEAHIINYVKVPGYEDCMGWVRVKGDCMAPFLKNGDYIAVKKADINNIAWGRAYFILFGGEFPLEPEVKYIRKGKDPEHWILRSHDLDKYEDQEVSTRLVSAVYRVRGGIIDI